MRTCREKYRASLDDDALEEQIDYRDSHGNPYQSRLLDIELHVLNHAIYHRAQAINMLRHLGQNVTWTDYIFMRKEIPLPADWHLPLAGIRYYFKYTDWVRDRVLDACAAVDDAKLDRPFEMGMGSIRLTLAHLADAEEWWHANWIGEHRPFPKPDKSMTIPRLRERFNKTASDRESLMRTITSDSELSKSVETRPAPDRIFQFPLGVSMLQLSCHATHHRA